MIFFTNEVKECPIKRNVNGSRTRTEYLLATILNVYTYTNVTVFASPSNNGSAD